MEERMYLGLRMEMSQEKRKPKQKPKSKKKKDFQRKGAKAYEAIFREYNKGYSGSNAQRKTA